MFKEIQKYGSAIIIRLDPQDCRIYDLKEGDIIDLEIYKVKNKGDLIKYKDDKKKK